MESKPVVQVGQTSGPDMAPLVAAVTALVRMHMQRDVAAYWDWVTRSGAQGMKIDLIVLALFFPCKLITGILVCLQVILEGG